MASRKDSKGRALRKGESQRERYYIFQYTDVTHKRRVVYAKDLPELREKEKEILRDLDDGLNVFKRATMTLNDAYDKYFSDRRELKHATKVCYGYLYDHYIRPSFGRRKLVQIHYYDVRSFYLILATEQNLSKKTLDMIHSLISQTMNYAVRDEILRINPAEGVMTELTKKMNWEEHKRHALTEEQQSAFIRHIMERPEFEQWTSLFTVLLGTGCRIGEVLGLRWTDVDFDRKLISINHSLLYRTLDTGKTGFYISTPKTAAGKRTIPMMKQVELALLEERECQRERNSLLKGYKPPVVDGYTDFVFTRKQKTYDPPIVNRAIRTIVASYNKSETEMAARENREPVLLPNFTCHHLRHTFCTRFCENEANVKVIQEIMGHANISTTMNIYAEATEAKKRECIENLENKIKIV